MKFILSTLFVLITLQICIGQSNFSSLKLEDASYESATGIKVEAQNGSFEVSENRANPDAAQIKLNFIRLKSTNPNPKAPLIYLEGGPGSSCTWQANNPRFLENWLPYLEVCDVILLDQRGTGAGTERVLWIWQEALPENVFVDYQSTKSHFNTMAKRALKSFEERGVDLAGYNTLESAKDINDLRKALGFDKISLFGFSYGTHLGLAYIRSFGETVENAILTGVEGPNHNYKLPSAMDAQFYKIAAMAKEDPNITEYVPDLVELYKKVISKLQQNPVTVEVNSPLTQQPMSVKIGPLGLNMIIRIDIGDASDIPVLPRLLYTIDQGDYSMLRWFMQKRVSNAYGIHGMAAATDLASGVSSERRQQIEKENETSLFKNTVNLTYLIAEEVWPINDLGDEYRSNIHSNIRTLFLSGTLDFNTPPYQAEEIRWGFPNGSHIIVKNAGHEQILTHPEATPSILRFIKGENVDEVALAYPKLKFIPIIGESEEVYHPSLPEND